MKTLIILLVILLVIGPLRRPLLSAWMIILPLTVGSILGYIIVTRFMSGVPSWMLIVGPVFGAFMLGPAIIELFNMMKR